MSCFSILSRSAHTILGLFELVTELALLALITQRNDVEQLPETNYDDIRHELTQLDTCHQGKAEPQPEHTTEIRYVLHCLHTT